VQLPNVGDAFVTTSPSRVSALIRWVTGSGPLLRRVLAKVSHAGIYVGRRTFTYNGRQYVDEPAVVEGRPSGAGLAPLSQYADATWSTRAFPLSPTNGLCNAEAAMRMIGTRYGWLNCFCIGLVKVFGWHAPDWALRVLASRRWEECAQLADAVFNDGAEESERLTGQPGQKFFDDGRPEGLVSPQDLDDAIAERDPAPATA
jgi:hypothetical protein